MTNRKTIATLAVVVSLMATAASAMTVQEFLTTASHIPHNPTALLRSDTRRLMNEIKGAFATIKAERTADLAAGRTPAYCTQKISLSADQILARLNTIPASRRNISVTQAMREWMVERYPCHA